MTTRTPPKAKTPKKTPAKKVGEARATKTPRTGTAARGNRAVSADGSRSDPAAVAFLRDLKHPLKPEIEAVRKLILDVSPEIREGLKWNAPSFHTTEHFATFNLRTPDRVRLILHTGAKTKATAKTGVKVEDPAGLLEWLAKDRCLVTFADAKDIRARGPALQAILREWMKVL